MACLLERMRILAPLDKTSPWLEMDVDNRADMHKLAIQAGYHDDPQRVGILTTCADKTTLCAYSDAFARASGHNDFLPGEELLLAQWLVHHLDKNQPDGKKYLLSM